MFGNMSDMTARQIARDLRADSDRRRVEPTTEPASAAIQTREQLRRYIGGGHGAITARSVLSRERYTFRFGSPRTVNGEIDGRRAIFVRVLTGTDNERDTQFLGTIWPDGKFAADRKRGGLQPKAAFVWLWQQAGLAGDLPASVEVWHEGRCAACGRALTTPASIEAGFGPVCAARLS